MIEFSRWQCMYACVHTCLRLCVYFCLRICARVCTCKVTYIHTYACLNAQRTHTHTHTHMQVLMINGYAQFTDLKIDLAAAGARLRFSMGGFKIDSSTFNVVQGSVARLAVDVQPADVQVCICESVSVCM